MKEILELGFEEYVGIPRKEKGSMTSSSSAPVTSPRGQGHLQDFLTGGDKRQQTG